MRGSVRRRGAVLNYFAIGLTLFVLLNLPSPLMRTLRHAFIFGSRLYASRGVSDEEMELLHLRVENEALKEQISHVKHWLTSEERIESYLAKLKEWSFDHGHKAFYQRRIADLTNLLSSQAHSIEAKVIFRDPAFWSSGIWIDKGEKENRRLGKIIVAKNSPVIVGNCLVGVVEQVEESRSFVRLITDSELTPSVRAIRGGEANYHLYELLDQVVKELELRNDDLPGKQGVIAALEGMKNGVSNKDTTQFLAKGELHGSSYPLWRQRSDVLKGIGFNYEFEDEEGGPMRMHEKRRIPLLQKGDLLITSGLDGIFPKGLSVAIVKKILPLKEGSFSYDLEAAAACPHLAEVAWVRICPPLIHD